MGTYWIHFPCSKPVSFASEVAVLPTVFVTSSTTFLGWFGLAVRLAGLAVFLLVAYRTFYNPKENQ